jgi:hypothetical protein
MVTSGSLKDSKSNQEPTSSILSHSPPRTIILGFSKGGVVVNQLVTELSYWFSISRKSSVDVLQRSTALLTRICLFLLQLVMFYQVFVNSIMWMLA